MQGKGGICPREEPPTQWTEGKGRAQNWLRSEWETSVHLPPGGKKKMVLEMGRDSDPVITKDGGSNHSI